MKKPIIIIALIILLAAGSVGALYAAGNLEGIVDKIFNHSDVGVTEKKREDINFSQEMKICENIEDGNRRAYCIKAVCDKLENAYIDNPNVYSGEERAICEEYREFPYSTSELAQQKVRDAERKIYLIELTKALKAYYEKNNQYPISKGLETTNNDLCVLKKLVPDYYIFELPIDSLDPEFYYTYKSDGQSYELVARLENLEDEECVVENGICLYSLSGGSPAPDYKKVEETKDKCKGSLEIMDEKCVDGNLEMRVKVSTVGDCPIVSFIANYADNKKKIAEFSSLGNNVYLVVLDNCNKVEKLIVSGEGGFTIN